MRQTETIAFCVLFLFFFSSSFIRGEDASNSSAPLQTFPMPSTSSAPQGFSTAKLESLLKPTLLSTSSEGDGRAATDLSANDTLSQSYNETVNSTNVPAAAGTTANTLSAINSTNVPGSSLTLGQDGSNPRAGNNQTLPASNTTLSTTALAKGKPEISTSAPSPLSETLSSTTSHQITTSPLATSSQSRGISSTVSSKGTSVPTTTTTTSTKSPTTTTTTTTKTPTTTTTTTTTATQTTKFSSTPVLAIAHVDNPSELNVGDNIEYSGMSMDPLLAGLVSVFVVTAAIVALLIFLKFRHRNERPEFRRLQDLPMDDMMEDTPLSMYSY